MSTDDPADGRAAGSQGNGPESGRESPQDFRKQPGSPGCPSLPGEFVDPASGLQRIHAELSAMSDDVLE
ncbi:MAG: hypothetical protein GXP36_03710, partial [Actinobacteria bacterium]|nr:hypothetical protein [Actinomycetota bacterium]